MAEFEVKATITCEVTVTIVDAVDGKEAKEIFKDNIVMNADMADMDSEHFCIEEDCIHSIEDVKVTRIEE